MAAQWYVHDILQPHVLPLMQRFPEAIFRQDSAWPHTARVSQDYIRTVTTHPWPAQSPDLSPIEHIWHHLGRTATAGSDVVQSGRPIFDDFFQHLWPYIGNNTVNVVFQMVKRLWLIRIDQ
ncbi:transposable element Tcb2 transposase [Trichonephila clavipes]|nr:transposable element Tcb2 transposase [Trichonephila clavipes]